MSEGAIPWVFPLWGDAPNPLAEMWQEVQATVQTSETADDWQFWIDWYQALLDGRPMLGDEARTWEMPEKIALIDPKDWGQGSEAVNPRIDLIWRRYKLLVEADALASEFEVLAATQASVEHRSHNQPPGLVEDSMQARTFFADVEQGIEKAREELEASEPSPDRLRQIADGLRATAKAFALYVGGLADVALRKGAEEIGSTGAKWAIRGVVALSAEKTEPVQAFALGLADFAKALIQFGG